jgi:hypothetical protein
MPTQTDQSSPHSTSGSGEAASGAQAKAAEMAGQAQQKAQQATGQAQEKLREQLNQRSSQAATQINEQASDLRSVSDALREQGKDGPAKAADRLAEYAEKAGAYLHEKDADTLLADAEDFGRRQPWTIMAGGLALGFAASRFLKASSRQRHQARSASWQSPPRSLPSQASPPIDGLGGPPLRGSVRPGAAPGV